MDYVRIIVYPTEGIDNIVRLPGTDNKAIFYSSLSQTPFNINISPFYSKMILKYIQIIIIFLLNQMIYLTLLNYHKVIIKFK